jgi:hypothetical protein
MRGNVSEQVSARRRADLVINYGEAVSFLA